MAFYLYQLKFDSPVHFGAAENGGKLEQTRVGFASDSLFGALCCELAEHGAEKDIAELVALAQADKLLFSDLFPYSQNNGDTEYYLPKPVINARTKTEFAAKDLQQVREQATALKKNKNIEYIRASRMQEYLQCLTEGETFTEKNDFSETHLVPKVNCREQLPYYVGTYSFHESAGLYGIISATEALPEKLRRLFDSLGCSGIGGKRSSGYGHFHLADEPYDLADAFSADDVALQNLLQRDDTACQLLLSSFIPQDEELEAMASASYRLRKRSGFVTAATEQLKKNSVYIVESGSCFAHRLSGKISAAGQYDGHNIYRYGKGLYAGLRL